ncbi:oxygen-dependent protoporphyrinogen oxidase [Acarospora aff. strigata]|nr:oxygen-dependent protoporphyrinogen oxidase [Acarospora aff. strigata]
MRLRSPETIFEALLRQCYVAPRCQNVHQRRGYSSTPRSTQKHHEVKDVAVLGGGITGLTSAYYLSQELPDAKITLYEANSRLGGWLESRHIDQVVFEQGPRTLRPTMPNGYLTLDLVQQLGFEENIITTSKTAPAAQNRFVYYPDHLVRMPGPGSSILNQLYSVLTEPLWKNILKGLALEAFQDRRPPDLNDESVGSFISRRFGPQLGDNVVSAILHGIYAGDINQLSMKSIQPKLWFWEARHGSIANALAETFREKSKLMSGDDIDLSIELTSKPSLRSILEVMKYTSVFTFKGGVGELVTRLQAKLKDTKNVNIKMNTAISAIRYDEASRGIKIFTKKSSSSRSSAPQPQSHTHAISTLSSKKTANLSKPILSSLALTHSVTVMVVNVFYKDPNLLSVSGFGYLIPRSIPFEQNPERALGVVFDSDATIGQDAVPGTKLTVMLGGHWWDGWNSYPTDDQGAQMARIVLRRHLNITAEPDIIRVSLQRECIPQYTVGHEDRLASASRDLQRGYQGRLRVAGNSYTGVGLNDCVRAARDVVKNLVTADGAFKTGLESFTQEKTWGLIRPKASVPQS